jgi:ribonuclease HI
MIFLNLILFFLYLILSFNETIMITINLNLILAKFYLLKFIIRNPEIYPGSSHFDAEFTALAKAPEMVAKAPNLPLGRGKAVIFLNCIAAIQSATSQINFRPQSIAFKKALVKSRSQNKILEIQWVPSHSKIWGNEKADALAKMGAKERPPPLPPEGISLNTTVQKVKTKIRRPQPRDS